MLEGKAVVQDTDMPVKMQLQAMSAASEALDLFEVLDCKSMAAHIKKVDHPFVRRISCVHYVHYVNKEFDRLHGAGWQCVVGSSFGCFFAHTEGTFIYFSLETLNFLIYKGA